MMNEWNNTKIHSLCFCLATINILHLNGLCVTFQGRDKEEKRVGRLTGQCQQRPCRETWPGTQRHVSHTWTSPMERSCTGCAWAWWETDCNTKQGPTLIQAKLQKECFSMQVHFAGILQHGSTFCTQKMTNKCTRLEIKVFPPFKWACERTSIKMHSTESGFVTGHQIHCLQDCMWALFSLEILHAGAVNRLSTYHRHIILPCTWRALKSFIVEGCHPTQYSSLQLIQKSQIYFHWWKTSCRSAFFSFKHLGFFFYLLI